MIIKTHHKIIILLLSYGFYIKFMLDLFHDKKCYNFINLFPCILWELIVMSLVLSWWRLLKKLILWLGSRLAWDCNTRERPCEEHMRKFNSQCVLWVTHDLVNLRDTLTNKILSVSLIPFTHNIYTLISHKIEGRLFRRKTLELWQSHMFSIFH